MDRAFHELADFECKFEADRFSLYVHDSDRRVGADPGLPDDRLRRRLTRAPEHPSTRCGG